MIDPRSIEGRRELVAIATTVAREAGAIAHRGYRKAPEVEHKGSAMDLVTAFDRASEEHLRARLTSLTPFPVVGEETGGAASHEAIWWVDPIDGTTNFVHGHPFYCVSVGLVVDGLPAAGVVVAPALKTEWTGWVAERAAGEPMVGEALRDGEPCRVSAVPSFGDALLATGFPYDRAVSEENNFDAFVSIKKKCQAVRRCGSAALDMCLVADGTYDGYWERKLRVWDLAAGAAVVLAAGGRITDYVGEPVRFGENGTRVAQMVATNGLVHAALVDALAATR